ncbi:MAG: serine hydrolase domain-containing protein [Chitinispirillaceae bacterium]
MLKYIHKLTKVVLMCISCAVLFSGCSPSLHPPQISTPGDYQPALDYIRKHVPNEMKRSKTAGLSICVVDSGRILLSEGFGYANLDTKEKVRSGTGFITGSVSKVFTATAIMQLVENDAIALDSPLTTYIPEFSIRTRTDSRPITVRDLLTHHSGLPCDIVNGFFRGQDQCNGCDTAFRNLPSLLSDQFTSFEPGTTFSYSNLGFSLLGHIIERVSGVTYESYMDQNIFDKVGMNSSAVQFDHKRIRSFSKGYISKKSISAPYIRDIPAGALVSSADDLARFMRAILTAGEQTDTKPLKKSTLDLMWTEQNSTVETDLDFRTGLTYILSNPTRIPSRVAWHTGDLPPYHAAMAMLPDSKLGVAVLTNSLQGADLPAELAITALEHIYEAKTGKPLTEKRKPIQKTVYSQSELDEIAGFYATPFGLCRVKRSGMSLNLTLAGIPLSLKQNSDSTFTPYIKLLGFIPLNLPMLKHTTFSFHKVNGKNLLSYRYRGITLERGIKFTPEPISAAWTKRAGLYTVVNQVSTPMKEKEMKRMFDIDKIDLGVDTKDHILYIRLKGQNSRIPLKEISNHEALIQGISRGAGETIRAFSENGEDFISYGGFILKKAERN